MNLSGLAATTWDDFAGQEPKWDYYVYYKLIEEHPGKVLDVGCGTGRLLIPYLALGIDIEGVDTSEEALAICRDRSAAQGLSPVLHRQHMQTLELNSRYRAIILPGGTFHLVGDPDTARESPRRFYDHLEPGGILAMSLDDPQRELAPDAVGRWTSRRMVKRPDGLHLHQDRMIVGVDESHQVSTTHIRFREVRAGEVVNEETYVMKMRLFFRDEIESLLEQAGFRSVEGTPEPGTDIRMGQPAWEPIVRATKTQTRP